MSVLLHFHFINKIFTVFVFRQMTKVYMCGRPLDTLPPTIPLPICAAAALAWTSLKLAPCFFFSCALRVLRSLYEMSQPNLKFQISLFTKQDRFQDCCKDWSLNQVIVRIFFFQPINLSFLWPLWWGPHLLCRYLLILACSTDIAINTLPVRGSVAGLLSEVARDV